MVDGEKQAALPTWKRPQRADSNPCSGDPTSPERAFVVQIADAHSAAAGLISGRVEHMLSGECAYFETQHQLIDFVRRLYYEFGLR